MCSNLAASYDNSQNAEFVQESSENMENDCKQPAGFIPAERADELSKKYNTFEEILKNENLK